MAIKNFGECRICGNIGKLTFEHVPPEAAFNDRRVFHAKIDQLVGGKWVPGETLIGARQSQRGAGSYTLCAKCNNDTGSWYGRSYVEFSYQAMTLLHRSSGRLSLAYPYKIYPLRVLKQIVTMFFSACGPGLSKGHPDLVRFVLNRQTRVLPNGIHVWLYLRSPTESTSTRQAGLTGRMILGGPSETFAEIAFPPFGLVLGFDNKPIDADLCNIDHFGLASYNTWDVFFLKLPVRPVVSFFPGDFRTVDEIKETIASNQRWKSDHLAQSNQSKNKK